MPVIMVHSLELTEEQKSIIAKDYTARLSELTGVPPDRIYVFFGGYPLDGIAAGGVLNSALPREALDQFTTRLTGPATRRIDVVSRMRLRPGAEERALGELLALVKDTRKEPGCVGYELYRSDLDLLRNRPSPAFMLLEEQWRDQAAIDEHLKTPHFGRFMGQVASLIDGPIEVTRRIDERRGTPPAALPAGHVRVFLRMKAATLSKEAVRREALELARTMTSAPGCLRFQVYQGFEGIYDPSVFIADHAWSDLDAMSTSALGRAFGEGGPLAPASMDGPIEPITFQGVSRPLSR